MATAPSTDVLSVLVVCVSSDDLVSERGECSFCCCSTSLCFPFFCAFALAALAASAATASRSALGSKGSAVARSGLAKLLGKLLGTYGMYEMGTGCTCVTSPDSSRARRGEWSLGVYMRTSQLTLRFWLSFSHWRCSTMRSRRPRKSLPQRSMSSCASLHRSTCSACSHNSYNSSTVLFTAAKRSRKSLFVLFCAPPRGAVADEVTVSSS